MINIRTHEGEDADDDGQFEQKKYNTHTKTHDAAINSAS